LDAPSITLPAKKNLHIKFSHTNCVIFAPPNHFTLFFFLGD